MPDFSGYGDEDLMLAIRKRLMEEIMNQQGQQGQTQNFNIGRDLPSSSEGQGGMFDQLGYSPASQPEQPDPEYGVDISRNDVYGPDPNWEPTPGMVDEKAPLIKTGWEKFVKRYRTPRGQDIERQKKK